MEILNGKVYRHYKGNVYKTTTKPEISINPVSELNGKYELDENHYFYFISPKGYTLKDGDYLDSYFQYYAPGLRKPLEGLAHGIYYDDSYTLTSISKELCGNYLALYNTKGKYFKIQDANGTFNLVYNYKFDTNGDIIFLEREVFCE